MSVGLHWSMSGRVESFTDGLHPVHDAIPVSLKQEGAKGSLKFVRMPPQQLYPQAPLPLICALQ